jgi:DNA-binding response OmpR family regulator
MPDSPRVLLVEDEPVTRMMIEQRLRRPGLSVFTAPSGEAAIAMLREMRFALMITDLYLETLDGVTLMAEARAIDPEIELIVLTGGATLASAVAAANQHVQAYLFKPVAPGALETAVAAALARHQNNAERNDTLYRLGTTLLRFADSRAAYSAAPEGQGVYQVGRLRIDTAKRRASVAGRESALSSGDFDLLSYLAARAERVISAEEIARAIFHHSCAGKEASEVVKARIHRLRTKLRDLGCGDMLVSVRGAGYMLTAGN